MSDADCTGCGGHSIAPGCPEHDEDSPVYFARVKDTPCKCGHPLWVHVRGIRCGLCQPCVAFINAAASFDPPWLTGTDINASDAAHRSLIGRMKEDADGQHLPSVGAWIDQLQGRVRIVERQRDEFEGLAASCARERDTAERERDEARVEAGRIAAETCGLREELNRLRAVEGEARHWKHQADDAYRERDAARKDLGADLAQRDRRIAELEAALRFQDPRNASARYDRIADDFHRETGLWAPGRSAPAAMGIPESQREEAHAKWRPYVDAWHERWFDAALSAPAQPATATKCVCDYGVACPACAKTPPSTAAREAAKAQLGDPSPWGCTCVVELQHDSIVQWKPDCKLHGDMAGDGNSSNHETVPTWKLFLPTTDREALGPERTEQLTRAIRSIERARDQALAALDARLKETK